MHRVDQIYVGVKLILQRGKNGIAFTILDSYNVNFLYPILSHLQWEE